MLTDNSNEKLWDYENIRQVVNKIKNSKEREKQVDMQLLMLQCALNRKKPLVSKKSTLEVKISILIQEMKKYYESKQPLVVLPKEIRQKNKKNTKTAYIAEQNQKLQNKRARLQANENESDEYETFEPIIGLKPEEIVGRKVCLRYEEFDEATFNLVIQKYDCKVTKFERKPKIENTVFTVYWISDKITDNGEDDYCDHPDKVQLIKDFAKGDAKFID